MDNALDPKPFFPRLLGRPFKRTEIKKASTPSSAYLADIARDSSPFPPPSVKPTKRKNTFLKAFTKAIPRTSGKGHRPDKGDVHDSSIIDIGEKSPRPSLRGLGIQDVQTTLPAITPTTALDASLSSDDQFITSASITSIARGQHPIDIAQGGFDYNTRWPTPKADYEPSSPPRVSSPTPSANATPSSISSIPLTVLGGVPAEPKTEDSTQPFMGSIISALKHIQAVVDQQPAITVDFLRSFATLQKKFCSLFSPGAGQKEESLYSVLVEDVSADITFNESAWPTGSDENIPKLMLSLPTEPDLTEGETTIVDEDARPVSPDLLSTQWQPTPCAVKRWRARAAAKKRQDFKLRKATSVPDLFPVASAFDMDVDDEQDEDERGQNVAIKKLSSDRKYMSSVASRIVSESKRGLGIVPDGFLPSREALALRLRKIPDPVSEVKVKVEGPGATDVPVSAPLAAIVEAEECESKLSPTLVPVPERTRRNLVPDGFLPPREALASRLLPIPAPVAVKNHLVELTPRLPAVVPVVETKESEFAPAPAPSSPLVGNLSAWTFMEQTNPRSLSNTQVTPVPVSAEPSVPRPRPSSLESLSARRMSRRSEHYARMNKIWEEKVLSQSDRRSSRGHLTGFTGIRPLILPTRVARRESSESGNSSKRSSLAESEDASAGVLSAADSFNVVAPVSLEETPPAVSSAVSPPAPAPRYEYF